MIAKFVGSAAVMGAGYGKQAPFDTATRRFKGMAGPRLRAQPFLAPQTQVGMGVIILNRILAHGRLKCEGALR